MCESSGHGVAHARTAAGNRPVALGVLLTALLCLAGCKQAIYSNLNEAEANDMLVVLIRGGIDAEKRAADNAQFAVWVPDDDVAVAIELLHAEAQPAQRYSSLGEVFERNGLISSPTEERMRYIHGLQQEVSHTLSQIDGVMVARVHIVVPMHDALEAAVKPASASVFIKHRPDMNMQLLVPNVKDLVVRSVEGLSPDAVSVNMFPARPSTLAQAQAPVGKFFGATLRSGSVPMLWIIFAIPWVLVAVMTVVLIHAAKVREAIAALVARRAVNRKAPRHDDEDELPELAADDRRAA
jgi:type III secretion protein J